MSGEVIASESQILGDRSSYTFANNGLRIHFPLAFTGRRYRGKPVLLASLFCQSARDGSYLYVYLQRTRGQQYVRCCPDELVFKHSPLSNPFYRVTDTWFRRLRYFSQLTLLPSSVHQVTVRENVTLRTVNNCQLKPGPESPVSACYHLELLPSAQHFVCASLPDKDGFDCTQLRNIISFSLSTRHEKAALIFECQTTGEAFSIQFEFNDHLSSFKLQHHSAKLSDCGDPYASVNGKLVRLDSGAHILAVEEIRADSKTCLEIEYIPRLDPEIEFLIGVLSPPILGFTAASKVGHGIFTIKVLLYLSIFPFMAILYYNRDFNTA
ncbi:hypothetical protein D9758_012586 [Tetrapyrgos nigripes]|uniref:Uncharacterized protein n=1 Tax=Tetrapyrgos nigripes TaxID=182062 RepID=A0A8H5FLU4_9AGAR|nr:hypothetical protein D9758_012586 [Tetrapyrgos nigripes]